MTQKVVAVSGIMVGNLAKEINEEIENCPGWALVSITPIAGDSGYGCGVLLLFEKRGPL